MKTCYECFKPLNDEEIKYYDNHCESCVSDKHHRMKCWKRGARDEELDTLYSDKSKKSH